MKKTFLYAALFLFGLSAGVTSCSDDNNNGGDDADGGCACIDQIIDGCCDIANEVGESKIGDPINKWNDGKKTDALYAVESWYSWHSRDDYSNNILSIRNSYYNTLDGTVAETSLSSLVKSKNATLNTQIVNAIMAAYDAILAIPNPFRNNIDSKEAVAAQDACAALNTILNVNLRNFTKTCSEEELDPIVDLYMSAVVLPTYKNLSEKNAALYQTVNTFVNNPSDDNFEKCAEAWLEARQPWETSEAFLFGPVDALGLDPNMDSWPLDQDAIVNILNSGNYENLNWADGDSNDAIEAAQNVRGFHTLEYLIFKDGKPRTIGGTNEKGVGAADLNYTSDNAKSWCNYMKNVATLLQTDANNLYKAWSQGGVGSYTEPFTTTFKSHKF